MIINGLLHAWIKTLVHEAMPDWYCNENTPATLNIVSREPLGRKLAYMSQHTISGLDLLKGLGLGMSSLWSLSVLFIWMCRNVGCIPSLPIPRTLYVLH